MRNFFQVLVFVALIPGTLMARGETRGGRVSGGGNTDERKISDRLLKLSDELMVGKESMEIEVLALKRAFEDGIEILFTDKFVNPENNEEHPDQNDEAFGSPGLIQLKHLWKQRDLTSGEFDADLLHEMYRAARQDDLGNRRSLRLYHLIHAARVSKGEIPKAEKTIRHSNCFIYAWTDSAGQALAPILFEKGYNVVVYGGGYISSTYLHDDSLTSEPSDYLSLFFRQWYQVTETKEVEVTKYFQVIDRSKREPRAKGYAPVKTKETRASAWKCHSEIRISREISQAKPGDLRDNQRFHREKFLSGDLAYEPNCGTKNDYQLQYSEGEEGARSRALEANPELFRQVIRSIPRCEITKKKAVALGSPPGRL